MKYNFDKIVDRRNTNAMSEEGYRGYLFTEEEFAKLTYVEKDLVKMWVADMDFETAPEIIDALKERVEHAIFGYTKVYGDQYYQAFLHWTQSRYDWSFEKEQLVNSAGVIPALFALIDYICKPKGKMLIMTPSYAFFKHAADFNGIELVTSDLICKEGRCEMDFDDLNLKMADEEVVLCLFCSPHNPTGRVWTNEELKRFGALCLENNVMIVSDEIHCDILRQGTAFTPLAKLFPDSDQIITCMAPSKTFNMAGCMFANIIIPNENIRSKWHEQHIGIENPLSVIAAQAAYSQGEAWLNELKIYLDDNFNYLKTYLVTHLPKAIFTIPDATYLAWVDVGAYFSKDENLSMFFANKAGVLLEGGNMFVANSDGFIRLNLASPKSIMVEGLDRIKNAIENHTSTNP